MKLDKNLLGIVLVVIGGLGILSRVFHINIFNLEFWPIFVLGPGLIFEYVYFSSKKMPSLLVPGGILTTIGLLFVFETMTNWRFSAYTWGFYTLAVAIGLFQLYYFGGKEKALLIPVGILTLVSIGSLGQSVLGFLFGWIESSIIVPVVLLLLGLYIITKKK